MWASVYDHRQEEERKWELNHTVHNQYQDGDSYFGDGVLGFKRLSGFGSPITAPDRASSVGEPTSLPQPKGAGLGAGAPKKHWRKGGFVFKVQLSVEEHTP